MGNVSDCAADFRTGTASASKGEWNGEQLIPAWWTEEIGKMRVVIPEDEKKALTHYAYHIKAGKRNLCGRGSIWSVSDLFP